MKPKLFNLVLLIGFTSTLNSQVILYRTCNYTGISKSLGTGYHNLLAMGIGNDNLSSIKVPYGYSITLYMDDNFKGAKTVYSEDISCLPLGWNNAVSSVYISYNENNNNRWWNNNDNNNNDGVTLYRDCNYQGYSKTLAEGSFTVYELGVGNDNLSSIRVPNGYSITLYVDNNYQGATIKYSDDISCLPYDWNDRVSSVTINRKWNNFGWNNNNNNNNNDVVTLFSNCYYNGLSKSLTTGSYRYFDLGIGNDQLSSIRISNGYSITLFQDDNYQGNSIVYTDDISCLSANWNERASSVIVSRVGDNNRGGWNNNNNNASVTLFTDCNYTGASSMLGLGYHNLNMMGINNDALSSIRVPSGYYAILYENDNYQGASTTLYNDNYCLPGNWNNRVSSIYVGQSGNNNNFQFNYGKITLYEDCNYTGASNTLGVGYHDLSELGIRNDALSSIRIPQGYSVTLYKDDNFLGSQTTENADIPCFNYLWNNKVSSIRVYKTGQ